MEQNEKEELIRKIEEFGELKASLSPIDAEKSLVNILSPLLGSDGYDVAYQGGIGDRGIDFLATKGEKKIGIQYKHYKTLIGGGEVQSLIGAAILNKLDKVILLANSGFSKVAKEYASQVEPISVELLDITDLKLWLSKIEADYDESEIVVVLRNCTQKIIELITKNSKTLGEIEWRDLERVIAEVFAGIGFDVVLTPSSKDGGKDVILECVTNGGTNTFIIEIKHWRSGQKVGEKKVKEFVKVLTKEKRDGGLFLSTYGFTENAVESLTEIEKQKVKFGQETKIVTLCKTYLKRKSGLWYDDQDLPEILFEGTC